MQTDPISDFITRIRNATSAGHGALTVRSSNVIKALAETLVKKHFIESAVEHSEGPVRELTVNFIPDKGALHLKRISKPGQRIYINHKEVKRVRNGLGIAIISTSRGLLTDQEARAQKVGGEYLCEVY